MRKLFSLLLLIALVFTSCDDGDIITLEISFDDNLKLCNDEATNLIFYNIKSDPHESLTLLIPASEVAFAFDPAESGEDKTITINGTSTKFNYRTYDGNPEFTLICQDLPGSSVNIINDYEAASGGEATFTSTFLDDDNDGVPSEMEDINGNGNLEDDDSDGDGIPDYIDEDDDNDNVLTKNENPDDSQDTDGDTILDYLDPDDDGDGVLTRNEDEDQNGSPLNDNSVNNIVRYLDPDVADEFIVNTFLDNEYTRSIFIKVQVKANLDILNTDNIELGTYTTSKTISE